MYTCVVQIEILWCNQCTYIARPHKIVFYITLYCTAIYTEVTDNSYCNGRYICGGFVRLHRNVLSVRMIQQILGRVERGVRICAQHNLAGLIFFSTF